MYEALQYYYGAGSVGIIIAIMAGVITFFGALLALLINFKKLSDNIRAEASWRTKVDMKLENIGNRLAEVSDIRGIVSGFDVRITMVERDVKAAHRRLDGRDRD